MCNLFIENLGCLPHEYFLRRHPILKEVNSFVAYDLFNVFCSIYYSDIMTPSSSNTDSNRTINVVIPVSNVELWDYNKLLIEKVVKFMSEDNWELQFIKTSCDFDHLVANRLQIQYDSVSLFSGGLDSLCGAYHNKAIDKKTIYCGYKLNTYESYFQKIILDFVRENNEALLFNKIEGKKKTPTQRTRSLLFLVLASLTAIAYNVNTISLYENGVLSINPEGYSRQTTKTTHPKTIFLFNKLLVDIGLNIHIEHPFLFKTKGEIINALNMDYKKFIKDTYTCGMSRQNPNYNSGTHCGVCIPCTLRKISIGAYDLEKLDREYEVPYGMKINKVRREHQGDYKSSNEYFMLIKQKIDNNEIFYELDLRRCYYNDQNYLRLTKDMFSRFSNEIEKYYSKYPIFD